MSLLDEFYGPNAGYVVELLEHYRDNPGALDPALRASLAQTESAADIAPSLAEPAAASLHLDVSTAAAAAELAQGIRFFGHLGAQLDPLGTPPPGDPQLEPATYGLTTAELERLPAHVLGGSLAQQPDLPDAAAGVARLREVYCETTGYEIGHLQSPAERAWLMQAIEERWFRPPRTPVDEHGLLDRLTELSAFERFLHRAYPGQTRFSIEGLGMLIPMLDEMLARVAEAGTRTVLLGMAHRGRLNVLAHVLGKPYVRIVAEFEGSVPARRAAASESTDEGWAGDVKYHVGGQRAVEAEGAPGGIITVIMAPNPSHLEAVDPVVEGMARASEENRAVPGRPSQDARASLAVLIHGDASFPGQGVVAETLNLSRIRGYSTGGTIHIIENNQLGFTTQPSDSRSTLYASDMAKGFDIPIVHVNADDPVACLAAVRLAAEYRSHFGKDVVIDLVGYRRWGHNEGDEPAFTQPVPYARISQHPTVREQFAADLVKRGRVGEDEPGALLRAGLEEFQRLRERVLAGAQAPPETPDPAPPQPPDPGRDAILTGSSMSNATLDDLRDLNEQLLRFPDGFSVHSKLSRPLQRRRTAFDTSEATIDWGHAETLALASLLREGTPIRLTGQDTLRGTFSQRHLAFYDARTGEQIVPLQALDDVHASCEVENSPLSENAALGFEYGYSLQAPGTLVIWEGQYGDFVNGAQVVIDEFIVSGEAKWGLRSGLVMLLPHAWEGQGPDHSGARLERFLQLAADDNIRVANCTTAGQYFHLLRRQAHLLRDDPRPLIIMTPKSLLRHALSATSPSELAERGFEPVLDDARASQTPDAVERVVVCSGKVWVDVESDPRRAENRSLAVLRLEQLYPFPEEQLRRVLERYPRVRSFAWLQEEPENMGAWDSVRPRLKEIIGSAGPLEYVGRPRSASPAEGWADVHAAEQRRIVSTVLQEVPSHVR